MSSRQKRSNGGYGLRRKVAKKRLDEDFEYYFSKPVGPAFESKTSKGDDNRTVQEMYIAELKSNGKVNMKNSESPEKRPRGRPKKIHATAQEPDISDTNLKFVSLKEKRCRKPKVPFDNQTDTCKVIEEIPEKVDVISNVACEEEVEDDCVDKRLKLDAVLSEEMTELREEEVSSIPEGEKENLPEEGVSLDSYSEERIIVPLGVEVQYEAEGEVELYEGEDGGKSYDALIQKSKRRYRRNRLNSETIRRLSQLSPDDKIECNECHKLLKPSSFRQHLRTHTGEKPFGCEVCEARFTRKGDVERHVRIVHNKQKPFKCCRCQRAFGDKKNLRWHLMNHDKKLFYVCEVCGFKFGKREYWENHVRYIHPLPGGMDPSEAGADEVDEERLQALTDSLLEDESADEPCHDNDSCDGETNENYLTSDIVEPVECRVIKRDGMATIPFKYLPSVVKVSNSKENDVIDNTSDVCVANSDSPGVEAVVIQINNTPVDENKKVSPIKEQARLYPANIIRVVAPRNVGQFRPETTDHEQPIVIDTRESESEHNQELEPMVQVFVPENEEINNEVDTIPANREQSKVISIVFNDEEENKHRGNVRSLIEVLLDAAHGQKKNSEISEKT